MKSFLQPTRYATATVLIFAGYAVPAAFAQTAFPSRNVQVITPYPPGGSIDVIARAVAVRLTEIWGKNVVVDNRPGANTVIATELVARAPADGNTLFITGFPSSEIATIPASFMDPMAANSSPRLPFVMAPMGYTFTGDVSLARCRM